jgi:uncharacterized protein YndB with AHSA1/START domain
MKSSVEVTTPSDREITVTRTFDASARLVFSFHTKPEHVRNWLLGPPGWGMPICEIDPRVGGRYHYVWRNDADGAEFGARGQFREIKAPERLVHTEAMEGVPGAEGGEALCTLTFVENGGRTTLTTTMQFGSTEARDMALQSGMTDGMAVSYDQMEALMQEAVA